MFALKVVGDSSSLYDLTGSGGVFISDSYAHIGELQDSVSPVELHTLISAHPAASHQLVICWENDFRGAVSNSLHPIIKPI